MSFISTFTSGEIGINSTMLNGAEIMIPRSISINNCFVLNYAFGITSILSANSQDKYIILDVRNFSFTMVDGQIYYRENSRMNMTVL